jgi:NAD(P)H-hydrate epimerase
MKILPVSLIREADAYTIAHEPIDDIDLMERAAGACFEWIIERTDPGTTFRVFAGQGNNGGDGLAIARMLIHAGRQVKTHLLASPEKLSSSCRINLDRLRSLTAEIDYSGDVGNGMRKELPEISTNEVVIDAIFGSGLSKPAEGETARMISHINASGAMVIAIDIPSGLFADQSSIIDGRFTAIEADYTLTFSPPKLAFFFPENDRYCGEWHALDIGIHKAFLNAADVTHFMVTGEMIRPMLHSRNTFAHKGLFGHALLISGSDGKMGAAILAAKGCLRTGPGLVTLHVPGAGRNILPVAVPEAMLSIDADPERISSLPDLSAWSAIGIGPGTGTSVKTAGVLKRLIQEYRQPLVLDADALNILGENKTWMGFLPPGSILTPHPKEFSRIVSAGWKDDFDRNRIQRDLSMRLNCYIVLKGAYTAITTPGGLCYFNTTGNPGMATGGSGDVLTGMLTGLLAQGYPPLESCLLGVFLHGLAGDLAMKEIGQEALLAGDLISYIGKSFITLYGKF